MTAVGRPLASRSAAAVSHVPRAEYGRWLREELRCSADLTRQRLRHYDIFTARWPGLADWLDTPLLDRVEIEALNRHEIGCVTRPNNGGVPTSYLTFASLRHGVRLDTPLLLMLKVTFALRPDAMPALGLDPDLFNRHRDRLVELGYTRAGAHGTVSWGLPRLAMWRGDPDLTAITADDLEQFAAEVRAFHETDAALAVSRMRARTTDRSPDRDAAGWAANRRHYQISRVFMLHVLLFNTGQADRPPDRGAQPARSWRDEIVPPGTPAAMAELASRWLHWRDSIDTTSSADAARRSRDALRCLITYLRAEHPEIDSFDQLTRRHIEGFLRHLPHRRAAVTGKPLSLSFRRIVISALRSFFQQANEMGWPGAPARNLLLPADQPRQPRALPRYVPEDELNRLMAAVAALEDAQQRAALLLLRWSGARRDEIRRLDLDCLDRYADGHPRLRIPVGKGLEERAIPLHPDAANALRELIEQARDVGGAARWDRRVGRHVRYVFSTRGQLRSPTFLFNQSLAIACEEANLVDADGKATITAHRFRHTVGTQLAEGGARLQTIMAILGHRSPQMAMIYTHLSDPTIRREYERVLGRGDRVAGPALETLLDPMRITQADVDWLKTNFVKTELELGHCLRLPQEGPCECDLYLRCPKFLTTAAYAPRLRRRLGVEQTLINDAHQRGWQREVERHTAISKRIMELLDELGEPTP